MADEETLMRYIRVFSELSGQLRYSAQKRVLTEIALIRLCRPQMETGLDSVLERVRQLEEKIEKGLPAAAAQPAGYPEPEEPAKEPVQEQVLKAAPEDLKEIRAKWKIIVGRTMPPLKIYLQSAVPRYDGNTGEAKLFLMFSDKTAHMYVNRPEAAQELQQIIEQTTGKTVEIEMILADQKKNSALSEISVDSLLEETVHMPIDYEDDDEPEEFE